MGSEGGGSLSHCTGDEVLDVDGSEEVVLVELVTCSTITGGEAASSEWEPVGKGFLGVLVTKT